MNDNVKQLQYGVLLLLKKHRNTYIDYKKEIGTTTSITLVLSSNYLMQYSNSI